MILVAVIDLLVIGILIYVATSRGLEQALPFVAFVFTLIPREAVIPIPGLFDLTCQRLMSIVLIVLYCTLSRKSAAGGQFATPMKWLILIHICWCIVSTANSVVPLQSIKKMIGELVEYYLLYFIFFRTISEIRTVRRILFAITAAVVVCSAFGTFEAYSNWRLLDWLPAVEYRFSGWDFGDPMERGGRIQTTFPHPILYGAGLVMGITLALYLLTTTKQTNKRIVLWVGLFLMFLNIYKTSSRGPWLAVMISFGCFLLLGHNRLRKYLLVFAALTVLVMVVRPGVLDTLTNIYYGTIDPTSPLGSSYEYRYALRDVVEKAVSQSTQRALWGYGMESFYDLHLEGELNEKPYPFVSCDSAWLELLIETGYVGLLIITLILLTPAWDGWRDFRALPRPDCYLSLTLLVTMVTYYFMMVSVAMYGWGQNSYMLWIVIAASLAYGRIKRAELAREHDRRLDLTDTNFFALAPLY